ncbi:MAG: SPOR domain-containing protein, partial [bacterium]|nr:SPOR domain-containing protein [bacterium]
GTEFEWLGASCGGRIPIVEDPPPSGDCASQFGSQLPDPAGSQSTTIAPTTAPATAATASLVPVLGAPSDGTWIVILMSASEADGGEAAAIQRAAVLTAEGDIPTGVFRSDDYASLNSGFWVVYTGQFDAPEAAAGRCSQLAQLVPECYHRLVEN